MWPPPLNVLTYIYYAIALHFFPFRLRSYRIHQDQTHKNDQEESHTSKLKRVQFTYRAQDPVKNFWSITFDASVLAKSQRSLARSQQKAKEIKDAALTTLKIENMFDEMVDIYLDTHYEKYLWLTMFPNTSYWFSNIPVNSTWLAYKHVIPYESKRDIDESYKHLGKIWAIGNKTVGVTCEEIHSSNHYLVHFLKIEHQEYVCDSCGLHLTNEKALVCENAESGIKDDFGICINCYYHAKLDTNLKIMEERLGRMFEGERWWGSTFTKPKARSEQNGLVKTIVIKYLEEKNNETNSSVKEDKPRNDTDTNNDQQKKDDDKGDKGDGSSKLEKEGSEVIPDEGVVDEVVVDEDGEESDEKKRN